MMKLQDKVAIVTGGASGIGAATVELFIQEGAKVIIADRNFSHASNLASKIDPGKKRTIPWSVDVSDVNSIQSLMSQVFQQEGRIDILVNNAGFGIAGTVEETSEDDLHKLWGVNVNGVFFGCKYVIPLMRKRGGGVIVNTASVAGLVGLRQRAAYCASKGAVIALTRAMALDHIMDNIRINCVAPGTILSPYFDDILSKVKDPDEVLQQLKARQPANRLGTPQEIAKAILFLASDESSFSVGSVLVADGGLSAV